MPNKTIDDLNQLYLEAEQVDQELFAEQRSNVLLVAGEHYQKKGSRFWNRVRDSKELSSEQKLRLTKNHIQKITKTYVNNILMHAPGVSVVANNEKELQDQKSAELHNAVWQFIRDENRLDEKLEQLTHDYVEVGEVCLKLFWDNRAGPLLGYDTILDEETGQPVLDKNGEPQKGDPKFRGGLVFERIFAANMLRHPNATDMDSSPCVILRKMVDIAEMKKRVGDDPDKLRYLEPSSDKTYLVFSATEGYKTEKEQIMLREYYWRPCYEYPNGYYWITTEAGVLFEGELPFGIWPIVYCGFDGAQTSPRSHSIIKALRPYQIEINRTASKIAEHQITLGDDKLISHTGSKLSQGATFPGVRNYTVSGPAPMFLPGRSGEQYVGYMESQIKEIYYVANCVEDVQEEQGQVDPYTLLFRSMRNKKKFSLYARKFERFIKDICKLSLETMRAYADESFIIEIIGKSERVNISEFKAQGPLNYKIKLLEQTDDIETKFGKQLAMNHLLQYASSQLSKEDIGKIARNMPYANAEQIFSDMTLSYDVATNDILALDRGEMPSIFHYEDHPYFISRFSSRMKQPDFRFLPPEVQQAYEQQIAERTRLMEERKRMEMALTADQIPTTGYLVALDVYVNDPTKPNTTRRARLPYASIEWLIQRLEAQGTTQDALSKIPVEAQAAAANPALAASQAPTEPQSPQAQLLSQLEQRLAQSGQLPIVGNPQNNVQPGQGGFQ